MKYEIIPIFLNYIKSSIALAKIPISLWITLSAGAGYLMYRPALEMRLFLTCQSIFLLTCSYAALNNYQDRNYDLGLKRTRGRPLPSHRITPRTLWFKLYF
ncbi:UbiA family prenyltransferase [Desulfococcaceae bacterium HSG7]|nr:UbiA family prenyltransferase [Desulfococcaceae bacterium HSG7]